MGDTGASSDPSPQPDSPSHTMIYPIRSLLSDVQPHEDPLPPSATTTTASSRDSRRLSTTGIGIDSPSITMSVPSAHKRTSIQQRRTAQWQANISERRPTGSGWLSSPAGSEKQDRDRDSDGENGLISLPRSSEPDDMLAAADSETHSDSPRVQRTDLPTFTVTSGAGQQAQTFQPRPSSTFSSPHPTSPSQHVSSKSTRTRLTHAPGSSHSYSSATTVPAQQLTRSNLKAFRDLIDSSSNNFPTANVDSGQILAYSQPRSGGSMTASNVGEGTAAAAVATLRPDSSPTAPASRISGIATGDNRVSNSLNGTSSNGADEKANSLVARGYVHLGPVRSGDVDRYSDRSGGDGGASARSLSALGSGLGYNGNGCGTGNGNGSRGYGHGRGQDKDILVGASHSRSVGMPPSHLSGLPSGVHRHPHPIRRGGNMGAPPVAEFGSTTESNDNGTNHGLRSTRISSDSPSFPYENSSASVNNNDSSVSTPSEADADADVENEGENSAQGRSGRSSSMSNYPTTTRFQHVETENGHHILLGRDGVLERCEDEPIHIPGAVQGFGVLIALEEDLDSGNLAVRIVSENCSEILGLTPSYLFNLECFTHTLPQMQVDHLWDNIQYLPEVGTSDLSADSTADEAPQIFLLSGYGQPGSAVVLDRDASRGGSSDQGSSSAGYPGSRGQYSSTSSSNTERRQWSCWCAAHRPKMMPNSSSGAASGPAGGSGFAPGSPLSSHVDVGVPPASGSLIILELELEHDVYNPLYPPPTDLHSPGGDSPGSVIRSTASVGSGGSGSAGVASGGSAKGTSGGSDRTATVASITPPATKSGATFESAVTPGAPTTYSAGAGMTPTTLATSTTPTEGVREVGSTTEQAQLRIGGSGDPEENTASWGLTAEHILASTTSKAQPIRALERMRQAERRATQRRLASLKRGSGRNVYGRRPHHRSGRLAYAGSGSLDVFSVLGQVNEQLSGADDLQTFLDIVVGIIKDLTQFHRVLVYQFDEMANGQVVAELVDYTKTKELYRGLHFPAADIPPQARDLYKINKVRSLYDRDQTTARLIGRNKADVETPLDLTHSYLRAMSPIHLKYLKNMGVRSSMSMSILSFGQLWGLVCCHSYGDYGMRVSFPLRQMLRLLSDSISRNIERLSYAHRLHTRKLINTIPTEAHPTGHIVSNAEDLLGLFDADFGVLVIGEGAKILGPNENVQDILIIAEYLRVKQFKIMQVTQDIARDFPDISLRAGPNVIAGVLHVPLSAGGRDFIALLRKGQLRKVTWAGRAAKDVSGKASLEPRASFKAWSEVISSRSRAWTDEQLETAGVLALVYGKFIDVWRQKETVVKATQLTNLLLSNASHEVRTPLNHIINYLELAMNGSLDKETRENLSMSHAASKNLLFTINDLLDLTRLESGNETSLSEPFDVSATIEDAVQVYRTEAERRNIKFAITMGNLPKLVIGDSKKIRTAVANLTANAVKYTEVGEIRVEARQFLEPQGLRGTSQIIVEVTITDTGCGIEGPKLEKIFRELEQVEHSNKNDREVSSTGLGLGLAVVAHIIGQLRGQLRVDSKPGVGSQFVFLIPFDLPKSRSGRSSNSSSRAASFSSVIGGGNKGQDEIDSIVEALAGSPMGGTERSPGQLGSQPELIATDPRTDPTSPKAAARATLPSERRPVGEGEVELEDTNYPLRSLRVDPVDVEPAASGSSLPKQLLPSSAKPIGRTPKEEAWRKQRKTAPPPSFASDKLSFNVLIVEDDVVNRNVLAKRLRMDGHEVCTSVSGQEAVELIEKDRSFDCILMDIQMPILNGFGAAQRIRRIEKANPLPLDAVRPSTDLNNGIPIFAVSASLKESQREYMMEMGMNAWILKPIDFKRLRVLMRGVTDVEQRRLDVYKPGINWEKGGWLREAVGAVPAFPPSSSA